MEIYEAFASDSVFYILFTTFKVFILVIEKIICCVLVTTFPVSYHGSSCFSTPAFSIQVNGTNVNLPVSPSPGVSVFMSGIHYTVSTNFGLTVRYDGNHFMDIKVIKE